MVWRDDPAQDTDEEIPGQEPLPLINQPDAADERPEAMVTNGS
jgi:hypothetical protein